MTQKLTCVIFKGLQSIFIKEDRTMKKQSWFKTITLLLVLGIILIGCMNVNEQPEEAVKDNVKETERSLSVHEMNVDEFFEGKNGTFILRDIKEKSTYIYNNERAKQSFAPQSTFKVPHSLIGLQVQAVEDEYDIKYWDREIREIDVWNQDHTLGSALRYSVVWYYKALARDIGEKRMQEWLEKIAYGNEDMSGGIDQFWLSSSLLISPIEQTDFMESLSKENLPFDQEVMQIVKRMMIQMEGEDYILYGKTGQGSGIAGMLVFSKQRMKNMLLQQTWIAHQQMLKLLQ